MPHYQPRVPQIVDPAGVQVGIEPRSMPDPTPANKLYRLGESLTALADQMSQYRWRHFVSVQRIIGLKPGTGGSSGVGWLQQVTGHRFFPELWSIRTML